jgi:phage terminase large subunit-like protein
VYAAATKREQAKIVWLEARRMAQRSRRLSERVTVLSLNLHAAATASKFEPLGADADALDGLNIHGAIIDELHAHKTRMLWDVLVTATGARRQPLIFAITTAGHNRAGVCYDNRTYVTKVLDRTIAADDMFGIIYTLDDGDDWRDPAVWAKANPNLGVTVQAAELAVECARAIEIPSARTAFQTKRLDVWVNAGAAEVDMLAWARAARAFTLEECRDWPCWIGVDLASKSDLAAVVAVFRKDGRVRLWTRFYLPANSVHEAQHAATAHYAGWAAGGYLTLTEGDLIDFAVIAEDIKALVRAVGCKEIDFDPYNATHIQTDLATLGIPVVEIPQNVKHHSPAMYGLRDLLKAGTLEHDDNPVMTWCVSNVVSHEDVKENLFPRKESRALKIDGYTALLNALGRALLANPAPSIYETRGVVAL